MIRVKVEDAFIKFVFEESGDVLKSTMAKFAWDLVSNGFVSAYVVNIGNVFTGKQPTVFRGTCPIKKDL